MADPASTLSLILLGTGTSTGVPVIGCQCNVCTSDDPRDRRLRSSALVQLTQPGGTLTIVIDTGPDFREQALTHNIKQVDAVCYTHAHFDHIAGLDDLRPYFYGNKQPLPCFVRASTAAKLRQTHPYVFTDRSYPGAPLLQLREVTAPFRVESRYGAPTSIEVTPLEVYHGDMPIYGYRIGPFAYLTDVSHIPESVYERLTDLDVLILDALRPRPHKTHLSIDQAVQIARRIDARETYFTHLTHEVLHETVENELPSRVHVGYDGCTLTCSIQDTATLFPT